MVKPEDAPTGFQADFMARLKPEVPAKCKGFIHTNGSVQISLEGNTLFLLAPTSFEKKMLDIPDVLEPASRIASGLLGRPIQVRCVERNKKSAPGGDASFQALMNFGQEHSDVIKFTNNR